MPLLRQLLIVAVFCGAGCAFASGQLSGPCAQKISEAPCVDKIDPPDWWAAMPSPMLLLHGEHLAGARFSVAGRKVSISRSQISANGHYAFVWLRTNDAAPQNLTIHIASGGGDLSLPFQLHPRKPESSGFQGFSAADTMYLIMTDRFADGNLANDPVPSQRELPRGWHGGDFKGIEQHLDYLQQLGITAIWITPAYDNSGSAQSYHGYSATDMYRPDPHFGTVSDYQRLIEAAHAHGIKFVLDTVPNHVGAAHPWALDPPTPDWFHGTVARHDPADTQFRSLPDPHASWQQQHDVTEGWFANALPDLNQENPLVSQYLIQNAVWWIETGALDGLRLDTFPYVGRAFWHDFHAELHALYPRLTTVGEVFNPDPTITSFFAGGVPRAGIDTGLWTPFDFPTYFALRGIYGQHAPLSKLENVLREDWLYPHSERLVPFLGNHDTVRFLSQPGVTVADLKLAFGIIATMRGMPQIYSGDEIAMRGGEDPDNRHDFPGGFPGDSQNAFTPAGRTAEQANVHDWVAALLALRKSHDVFATGQQQDVFFDDSAFVYVRTPDAHAGCTAANTSERYLIAVNNSDQPREIRLDENMTALAGCARFTPALPGTAPAAASTDDVTLTLSAKQLAIYRVK